MAASRGEVGARVGRAAVALAQAAPAAVSAAALRRGPRLRTAGAMRALSTHQAEGVAATNRGRERSAGH